MLKVQIRITSDIMHHFLKHRCLSIPCDQISSTYLPLLLPRRVSDSLSMRKSDLSERGHINICISYGNLRWSQVIDDECLPAHQIRIQWGLPPVDVIQD
jgi:hypothetical protein